MDNSMIGQTFPLIEVSGSAYNMGYQHGRQAAGLVHKYLLWIEKLTGKSREELCQKARAFRPLIEKLSPPLLEEIQGLADGAGISFDEALLCQARGEAARVSSEGCTAFALTGSATADGAPLAGQNQDLAPEYADVAILLRVCPSDGRPRALLFTFAGQLGYSGMNEYGLAHFANALYDSPWQMGLPHYPLKRIALEQDNLASCIRILKQHPTCSAGNMVFCFGDGQIADLEIARRTPKASRGSPIHTPMRSSTPTTISPRNLPLAKPIASRILARAATACATSFTRIGATSPQTP